MWYSKVFSYFSRSTKVVRQTCVEHMAGGVTLTVRAMTGGHKNELAIRR